MDHLQRLIVAFLLAVVSFGAAADGTVSPLPTTFTLTRCWPVLNGWSGGCFGATTTTSTDASVTASQAMWAAIGPAAQCQGWAGAYQVLTAGGFRINAQNCVSQTMNMSYNSTSTGPAPVSCPANATKVGSTCTCNAGYLPNAGATACGPLPPPICKTAALGNVNYEFPVTPGGSVSAQLPSTMTACSAVAATATNAAGGCTHLYELQLASRASDGSPTAIGNYTERTDGTNCTPSANPDPVPVGGPPPTNPTAPPTGTADDPKPTPNPSSICALGTGSVAMCPTMINGAVACVVCGQMATAGNGGSGGTGAAPAGAASAPGSGSGSGGSGQTVNTGNGTVGIPVGGNALQGTECTNGVCVTMTFIRDAGGTVVGSYTSSSPETVFCSKNPGDPICVAKNTGTNGKPGTGSGSGSGSGSGTGEGEAAPTFGGSCGAGFTCTGDAVQCAMARDQMVRNCQTLDNAPSTDPVVQAATAAASSPVGHPINSGTSKVLSFDQTNIMSGSCPADVSVTVSHFNAVTLPFSSLCTPATWLGNILVGITALSCLGIVFVRGS